jgi:tetratricopeptide (TPR) repeat protein
MLWNFKGYIQCDVPGGDILRLAVTSTPEEWTATGRTLFTSRRYLQAMHAFERAGRAREAKIAKTYSLRDAARSTPFSKESMSGKRNAFSSAAKSFWECAEEAKGKERRVFFHNAADCFEEAGTCGDNMEDYRRAAQAYENAKEYAPAVRLYRKTEMFDEAVQIIQTHRQEVGEELASNVLEVARLFYFKNKEFR